MALSKVSTNQIDTAATPTVAEATVTGDLTVDTNTLHVDAANNRVGVLTASPSGTLDVNISTNARGYFVDSIGEVGSGNFALQIINSAGSALKPFGIRAEDIRFATGSSERVRVTDNGLTFNGDTATANALDDYEEGNWTPDLQDGGQDSYTGAYAAQLGKYTKVGNMITVWAQINASAALNTNGCTGGESVRVAGLPFASLNDSGAASYTGSATNINSINFPSGYTMLSPSIGKGASHINLKLAGDNVSDRSLTCTEYQSGEIFLCVTYRAT